MIPDFPTFKHLELSDREEFKKFIGDFLPYSDFNFTSLWCWDVDGGIMISNLSNNLVIRFTDYVTGEPFYSFLGRTKVNETVEALIALSHEEKVSPIIKLLPYEAAKLLQKKESQFIPEEDRDNFDYLIRVDDMASMEGHELAAKRNYIRQFIRNNQFSCITIDPLHANVWEGVSDVCTEWARDKGTSEEEFSHEYSAIKRYFSMDNYENHIILGVMVNEELVAFWAMEMLSDQYAISHFQKAKIHRFRGVYPFLNQAGAKALQEKGIKFINLEQDLGIPGLREGKEGYGAHEYIKKFTITSK